MGNFKIVKKSNSFKVSDVRDGVEYEIKFVNPDRHACYLTCTQCGYCVHTFRCDCKDYQKKEFCLHLHLLSNAKERLPFFETPPDKRLVKSLTQVADSTECSQLENDSSSINQKNPTSAHEKAPNQSEKSAKEFETVVQNARTLLAHYTNQLDALAPHPARETFAPHLENVYQHLLKGINILPTLVPSHPPLCSSSTQNSNSSENKVPYRLIIIKQGKTYSKLSLSDKKDSPASSSVPTDKNIEKSDSTGHKIQKLNSTASKNTNKIDKTTRHSTVKPPVDATPPPLRRGRSRSKKLGESS